MGGYMPRIADLMLKTGLKSNGAVFLEGPFRCGKTASARRASRSLVEMEHPDLSLQYREMAKINPSLLLRGETPRFIDEWQTVASIGNAVLTEVDHRGKNGQFVLAASVCPSKAGKNAHFEEAKTIKIRMRPMSLFESKDSTGEVSLNCLFHNKKIEALNADPLEKIAFCICRGGWPEAIGKSKRASLKVVSSYLETDMTSSLSLVDGVERNAERAGRLIRSYAGHIGTQASLEAIREGLTEKSRDTFSQDTMYSYLRALKSIFIIEDAPAWRPRLRSKTAIRTTDTRFFVDPSVGTAALGLAPNDLINNLQIMKRFFENMCIRDLRVYAELFGGSVSHYRDKNGLECDAVIEREDGSYGLVEIRLGGDEAIQGAAGSLCELSGKIDTKKMKKPAFAMILTAISPFAYQREDGIYVVPIGALGP